MRSIRYALLTLTALTGCALSNDPLGSSEAAVGPKSPASTPTISIVGATQTTLTVKICAGSTGMPAGYSLHWLEESLLGTTGAWPSSETEGFCDASFSGNARDSRFDLGPYECATVLVGALATEPGASWSCNTPLQCGTEYAFRGFAHGNSSLGRSEWASTVTGWTSSCSNGCTYTQGYWKNHSSAWSTEWVKLGSVIYSKAQMLAIFGTPVKGNGLVSLAHQLAAAKLNIAAGASVPSSVAYAISAADALIGWKVVPSVGWDSLAPSTTSGLNATLTLYNEGTIGPGHCGETQTWSAPRTTSIPSPTPSSEKGLKAP